MRQMIEIFRCDYTFHLCSSDPEYKNACPKRIIKSYFPLLNENQFLRQHNFVFYLLNNKHATRICYRVMFSFFVMHTQKIEGNLCLYPSYMLNELEISIKHKLEFLNDNDESLNLNKISIVDLDTNQFIKLKVKDELHKLDLNAGIANLNFSIADRNIGLINKLWRDFLRLHNNSARDKSYILFN